LVKAIGKPFWQSETGPSGNSKTSFGSNLGLAQKLFDDMRYMKPQAWLDWQLMEEGNDVWCLMRCNFNTQEYNIVKNFYVRMQITRFFKQGYSIIETGNDEVLAAINPEKTELVVAVINKSDQTKPISLNLIVPFKSGQKVLGYRTSQTENCSNISIPEFKDQSISYNAPSLSLTTFVVSLGK
jgi:O-glycosyl hydrolase